MQSFRNGEEKIKGGGNLAKVVAGGLGATSLKEIVTNVKK